MIRGDSGRLSGQVSSPGAVVKFEANIRQKDVQLSDDQIILPATPAVAVRTPLPAISERVEKFASSSLSLGPSDQGNTQAQSGQAVLLVEDNHINMRVSSHSVSVGTTCITANC